MVDDVDVEFVGFVLLGIQVLLISWVCFVYFVVVEVVVVVIYWFCFILVEIDFDYLFEFLELGYVFEFLGFDVDFFVVEDNFVNQEVYVQIFGMFGISYELVRDGVEVLCFWDILYFLLVFMDLGLFDMIGCEVVQCIWSLESGV